ncbi:MAG: hypothetical protein EOO64_00690 [Massilia sp.]|nr:MAG: hypothetical protein EOO64_00690 [Massilia sp.]
MSKTFPMKFGDAGQYELSEVAFNHILWGDTAVRVADKATGRPQQTVLSGGLHTHEGWKKFAALHPNVVHLLHFQAGVHDAWYYARELQNGVVTLKIPRRLFTGSAASITKQPDNYYKSGYLWKTLFPIRYSEADILRVIGEALKNLDQEDSDFPTAEQPAGVLYGYADSDNPFTAIKIRIQVRGNYILSAFPAWEQPLTGNNGKAYSHEHSISFQIALSTLEYEKVNDAYGPAFPNKTFAPSVFLERTPDFIRERQPRNWSERVDANQAARGKVLRKFAGKAKPADLDKIDSYLADYPCAKDPFGVQRNIYMSLKEHLAQSTEFFNAAQLTENIGECVWVLAFCDNRFKTRRAINAIVRFLSMAIVHTGGLNTLMFKRLVGKMISIAQAHQDASALKDVLEALASSPCRAALYTEFDLNPFVKKNDDEGLSIIGLPFIEMEIKPEHLVEFIAFSFGENYLAFFSKPIRLQMAADLLTERDQWQLAKDVMSRFTGNDFAFFMPDKLNLASLSSQALPRDDDLRAIVRDYGRMLLMLRQRIILEDPASYQAERDFSQYGTPAFFELMRQKHKYMLVRAQHLQMLEVNKAFAEKAGLTRLSDDCKDALERFPKERIPMPKHIPDYIDNWRKKLKPEDVEARLTLEEMFDQPE